MKRLTTLAVLLLASICVAGGIQPFFFVSPTHFLEDIVVPGYDSAGGPLNSVTVCWRYKHVRSMRAESSDAQPAVVSVNFQPGFLEFRTENDLIANVPFPTEAEVFSLGAFDGDIDFQGRSGFRFRSLRHGHGIVDITDPAIIARFVDVETVALTARGFDLFTASGAGNLIANSDSRITVQGEVIYNN